MQPDPEAFVAAVRGLDAERRTAFVAALWRARGRTVERVGPAELRLGDGRRLATRPGVVADPDLLVALDGRTGPGVVDGERLHEIATYAVDRAALAALSERFFGRPLDALATGEATGWRRVIPAVSVDGVAAVLVVAVALVAVAVVGGGGVGGSGGAGGDAPATGSGTPTLTAAPTPTDGPAVTRDRPPGVSPDGAIDEAALVAAHYDALAGRSYRVTLTYREFVADEGNRSGATGAPTAVRRETVQVADGRYAARVTERGEFRSTPTSLVASDSYATATAVVVRTDDGVARYDRRQQWALLNGQARLLGRFLSVESSAVTGTTTVAGESVVWLATDGDPWPGVANATGTALVGRDGLVHEVRRRYDDPDDPRRSVVVTLRVEAVGATTVEPPAWYANATAR